MKVIVINGSPHKDGTTNAALHEAISVLEAEGIECELMHIGSQAVRGCTSCLGCKKTGKCVIDDCVNTAAEKFKEADGIIVGSPVYYASPNGTLLSFMDRLFFSSNFDKTMKVGAAVAAARRGGLTATFDQLNKYFTICGMPVASGQYWNGIHGRMGDEALGDEEGLQTMRTLAKNMAFLMKSIALGKEKYGLPEKEKTIRTNFIR